jgi:tetratricopeptide (TPR) repeat protein
VALIAHAGIRDRLVRLFAALVLMIAVAGPPFPARADERSEILFTEGLVALRQGDLATARARLREAADADPRDAASRFWLGVAASRAGDDRTAVAAFDEALAIDPDYPEALFARGVSLDKLGDRAAARRDWSRVAEMAVGTAIEREARRQLEIPRRAGRRDRRWDLTATLGAEYDTNVLLFPNLGASPATANGTPRPRQDHQYDARMVYYVDGAYRFRDDDRWTLGTRHSLYAATQFRTEDLNLVDYSPSLFVNYKSDPVTLGLQYTFTLMGLGGRLFLARNAVEPSVTIREGKSAFTRAYYRYAYSAFHGSSNPNTDETGNSHIAGLDQYKLLFDQRGYVRAGVEYERDFTRGTEYDGGFFKITAELLAPLPEKVFLRVQGENRWGHYSNDSVFSRPYEFYIFTGPFYKRVPLLVKTGDPKRELLTTASATLSRDFAERWTGAARYTYIVNQSTIDAFDYNRSIFSVFATYNF